MKTWNQLSRTVSGVLAILLVAGLCVPSASAQMAKVNNYTTSTSTATWIDATGGNYLGYDDDGYYSFTAPFAFPYDSTTIAQGATMAVSDNGVVEVNHYYYVNYADDAEGNSTYPGAICLYSTDMYYDANSVSNHGNYWNVTGSSPDRILTVEEYANSPYPSSSPVTSFEVQIHETSGIIDLLYSDHNLSMKGSDNSHPVGIGLNGETNVTVDYNSVGNGSSTPSNDIRFTPPGSVPKGKFTLIPTSLDFGSATPNSPDTLCVTAKNVGVGKLDLQSAFISGSSAYTIVSGPGPNDTLSIGQSVNYCIQFLPLSGGTLTGTFTIVSNSDTNAIQSVNLTGIGALPAVSYGVTNLFRRNITTLGDTSAPQYIPITSTGGGPLHLNGVSFIGLDAASYFVSYLPQNPLPVGVTDSIGIRFSPTIEGRPDASVVINTDAQNKPLDTVSLLGVGSLPHLIVTVPPPGSGNTVMFDSVAVGDSVCQTLTLTNPGTDTLEILKQLVTYGDYDFTFYPLTGPDTTILPGGGTKLVNVCFKPLKVGTRLASIRFYTNIPKTFTKPSLDTSQFVINLTGVGVPFGHLTVSGSLNDTAVVGKTNCMADTLMNNGQADLTVTKVILSGPNSSAFTISGATPPFTLTPGEMKIVTLCYTAASNVKQSDTLLLSGTTSEKAVTTLLLLNGIGVETCVSADSLITFGQTAMTLVGVQDTSCVTVTNCGDLPATYTASNPTGTGYTLISPTTSAVIAPGGTAQFCVSFTPTSIGAVNGSISISGGPNPTTTLLGGVGAGVLASASGAPSAPVSIGDCQNFDVTITNNGNVTWTPGTPSIGGANASDFTLVSGPAPTTIAAAGTATVTIKFCPTTQGSESMTLTFPSESPVPVPGAFSFTATGVGATSGVTLRTEQDGFVLGASYPNPTSGQAAIEVTLPRDASIRIDLLDATGALVRTAFSGNLAQGTQTVALDAKGLPSGTYFYMLTSGDVRLTRQMSLIK